MNKPYYLFENGRAFFFCIRCILLVVSVVTAYVTISSALETIACRYSSEGASGNNTLQLT